MKGIYRLKGVVQHYSWGGYEFIPNLLKIDNKEKQPFAEYWLGAHPKASSVIHIDNKEILLQSFIENDKEGALGKTVAANIGSLPYLLKLLDVRQMLSIQVHPEKERAKESYWMEEEKNIPINAPHRNYKDENHKPEMMVAVGDFWLLHGFKPREKLLETLNSIPQFNFFKNDLDKGLQHLYESVMNMEQQDVNEVLAPIIEKLLPLYRNGELLKDTEDFWVARAAETFCANGNMDRGIFSIYFFNLLHLKRGEGVFQPPGLPHAYLEGQNVELMANSDNVLRAGLTDKHIDITELMKHVKFEETKAKILKPRDSEYTYYKTPAAEFQLESYKGMQEVNFKSNGPEMVLVLEGKIELENIEIEKGEAVFIQADLEVRMKGSPDSLFFRVQVPNV